MTTYELEVKAKIFAESEAEAIDLFMENIKLYRSEIRATEEELTYELEESVINEDGD